MRIRETKASVLMIKDLVFAGLNPILIYNSAQFLTDRVRRRARDPKVWSQGLGEGLK